MCYKKLSFLNLIWLINQTVEYSAIYYQQSSVTAVNLYADNSSSYWTVVGFGDSQPSMELTKCQPIMYPGPKEVSGNFLSVKKNEHAKACAKGNDIITNVISANQHYTSTFCDADIWRRLKKRKSFITLDLNLTFMHTAGHGLVDILTNMRINLIGLCN